MDEIRVITATAGLGYGFPEESIMDAGVKKKPHVLAVDAGSTDPGPHYLGIDEGTLSWQAQRRDLEILMRAREELNVPLIVGSAATAGARPHVEKTVEIVKEIARENGYRIKVAKIGADIEKDYLKQALKEGRIRSFEHPNELTVEEIERSKAIVGQMGIEPFIEAIKQDADVIIAGRAYDPSMMAAYPIMNGFDPGLAIHMGKILECGAYAAEPSAFSDCLLGTIRKDHFVIEPLNPALSCTVDSVAAHTLYEKDSPVKLAMPGGMIDLSETTFEALSDRAVKVTGTRFIEADQYTVKLEGVARVGFRSIYIGGVRDPLFIKQLDEIIAVTKSRVADELPYSAVDYKLFFHVYGRNGVMQHTEPMQEITSHELGIVGDVVAKTQEIAHNICSFAHGVMLHHHYEGRKSVAGNMAFPYSPHDLDLGEVFEFNIYHLLELDDPVSLFPVIFERV